MLDYLNDISSFTVLIKHWNITVSTRDRMYLFINTVRMMNDLTHYSLLLPSILPPALSPFLYPSYPSSCPPFLYPSYPSSCPPSCPPSLSPLSPSPPSYPRSLPSLLPSLSLPPPLSLSPTIASSSQGTMCDLVLSSMAAAEVLIKDHLNGM